MTGRLSTLAAAIVVARRDFTAILFSRSFIFFLLGPLFPIVVGAMAGGVGQKVQQSSDRAQIGIAMEGAEAQAMLTAYRNLAPRISGGLPEPVILSGGGSDGTTGAGRALEAKGANLAAVISGSPAHPVLTGTADQIDRLQGPVSLVAAAAVGNGPMDVPEVSLAPTVTSTAKERQSQVMTAQAAQTLLFLLTMLLAGMVLSNLVEEKGNKIIEILAAAIPMDAVFLGKLFAMLAVSMVGIAVWGTAGGVFILLGQDALPALAVPAVGWPLFLALGVAYFSMAYLLLGSAFLTIGSMASTVREVQTLSMPVTMMQLMVFFLASYAMTVPGSAIEWVALIFPFSSPFAMMARAAQTGELWPHAVALAWQALCVAIFIRAGAGLFRQRVMKSGPARRSTRMPFWRRLVPAKPFTRP